MVCVRENSEGEYAGRRRAHPRRHAARGGASRPASSRGTASSAIAALRASSWRAKRPRKLLASATKSNALHALDGAVGRGRRESCAKDYPVGRRTASITSTRWRRGWSRIPQTLDVIVASNLFGDILTDIGSAISGSLGIAPGANINPERDVPVDVRADPRLGARHRGQGHRQPDRRDLGRRADARPSRAIATCTTASSGAIERVVAGRKDPHPDLGGTAKTKEMADAIVAEI